MNELSPSKTSQTPSPTLHTIKINRKSMIISLESDKMYEFSMNHDQISLIRKFAKYLDIESSEVNTRCFNIFYHLFVILL